MSQSLAAIPAIPTLVGDDPLAERRRRRRRTFMMLGAISVGWKVVVFTLGAAMPRWLVTDGVAELPELHRAYGTAALATAGALFDTRVERFGRVVQRVRVMSVDSVRPLAVVAAATGAVAVAPCALEARVRAYTYFAIPYSEVRTRCEHGVIEYRVFRPATRDAGAAH